jgi:hypothetical protein
MLKFSVFLSVLFLAACGSSDSNNEKESKNGGVIPQHQLDALEKAKNMGDVMEKAGQDRREEMDSQGG